MPRLDRGIQYSATSRLKHCGLRNTVIARSSRAMTASVRRAMPARTWRRRRP